MSENVTVFKESVRELQVSHLNTVHKVSAGKNVAQGILLALRTGQRKDNACPAVLASIVPSASP